MSRGRSPWAAALVILAACSGCDENPPTAENSEDTTVQVAPYGTWASPISASLAAGAANAVLTLAADGEDLYWLESRPLEGGRSVLMRADDGPGTTVTPESFNVRTRVHEYGGASFLVAGGDVYFSNFADQALYAQRRGGDAERLTVSDTMRYADCALDARRNRLICVREDHSGAGAGEGAGEAVNAIAGVSLEAPNDGEVLWAGSDFVAYPRLNGDGTRLAWIAWDHPNMPWDNVALWLADVGDDGALENPRRLNADVDESVLQPTWAADGTLYFLTDRSGWWNLHRLDDRQIRAVHDTAAEFGGPLWALGADFFALVSDDRALVSYHDAGGDHIGLLSLADGGLEELSLPFVNYGSLHAAGGRGYFIAGRDNAPGVVVELDLNSRQHRVIHESGEQIVADGYLSHAQPIQFPTAGGQTAYAYYYPPTNADYAAPDGELPPLMVLMHGGPTGAVGASYAISKQYWTSRGIAIVDVNYRGSTGYGRDYRKLLNGQWGVVDLEDAVAATRYLVEQGLADPHRLLIRGGSAGGYTTLSALAFTDVFAAGANYFGVSDLEALAKHTHKFESRYLDSMIGPYPEAIDVYKARSPIHALDGFSSPLITFQGLEDKVVPPPQSEAIYEAVKAKGVPTAYVPFEGEQHGFRMAENIVRAMESELYFYGKVLGFEPAGELPAVTIDNLVE